MRARRYLGPEGLVPLFAGPTWLAFGAKGGWAAFALSLLPGALLAVSGAAEFLGLGGRRVPRLIALGAVVGVLLAPPAGFIMGFSKGSALAVLSAACFVAAGLGSLRQEPHPRAVPPPRVMPSVAFQVAVDEVVVAVQTLALPKPTAYRVERVRHEVRAALALFKSKGWLESPVSYHREPPALQAPATRRQRLRRLTSTLDYEYLSFESEYEPWHDEPGRERWLSYTTNRTAYAAVLRHTDRERPWLVCIHGYGMGSTRFNLWLFDPVHYHRKLGLNMLVPVLPLHGPRASGWRSGHGFLAGNALDTVHAEAQSIWDIRRMLSWVRAQSALPIGVHGVSLGGYNAALLAGLEDDLACVIAGVPAVDLARLFQHHVPPLLMRYIERSGIVHDELAELYRVVSPLAVAPRVPREALAIYAGISDRLVPSDQPRDLWEHWDRPAIVWSQGGHNPRGSRSRELIETTLRRAGMIG